jgi:hypothetical protein
LRFIQISNQKFLVSVSVSVWLFGFDLHYSFGFGSDFGSDNPKFRYFRFEFGSVDLLFVSISGHKWKKVKEKRIRPLCTAIRIKSFLLLSHRTQFVKNPEHNFHTQHNQL